MITDALRKSSLYASGAAWKRAFEFLRLLPPGIEDGKYEIQGDDIFAIVMSYTTRTPEDGILEAHRKYVDVQTVLSGREGCEWYPVEGLATTHPYDEGKDAEFYRRPGSAPAQLLFSPGFFAVFFPGDAHMTSLTVGDAAEPVKKVVVKIKADLLVP